MSAPATPGGRRSTCSIWGGPTSIGSGSRAVSACRARGSRQWRNSTGASPTRSLRRGRSSSKWCCRKKYTSPRRTRRMRRGRRLTETLRVLCETTASSAVQCCFVLALLALCFADSAGAACSGPVADHGARLRLASAGPEGGVGLTFLGHASFLIESPQGVTIVTEYNDLIREPVTPVFTQATLEKFLARAAEFYTVKRANDPSVTLTRATLPGEPEMLVLPGR